jgi:hypothetical protein
MSTRESHNVRDLGLDAVRQWIGLSRADAATIDGRGVRQPYESDMTVEEAVCEITGTAPSSCPTCGKPATGVLGDYTTHPSQLLLRIQGRCNTCDVWYTID